MAAGDGAMAPVVWGEARRQRWAVWPRGNLGE
jgi:hypothetical protein